VTANQVNEIRLILKTYIIIDTTKNEKGSGTSEIYKMLKRRNIFYDAITPE